MALSPMSPLSPCIALFSYLKNCLHYIMWFLDTHISLICSPIVEIFSPMKSIRHFLYIYLLGFPLEEKSCLQTLRRFYGITSLWRYPLVGIIIFENQDGLCFLWEFGLWILTTQPFHFYTLAYYRHIHLIFIEFLKFDNNPATSSKKHFSLPSIVKILQSVQLLWLRFSL